MPQTRKCKKNVGVVNGFNYKEKGFEVHVGSRAQVGHGTAYKTSGGLTCKDLVFKKKRGSSTGRWVSKKKSMANPGKHLGKYLDRAKQSKGKPFVPMRVGDDKMTKKKRR